MTKVNALQRGLASHVGVDHFTLDQAREAVASWAEDYNTTRPHSSLAYETPAAYAAKFAATGWHATPLRGSACQPVAQPAQQGIQQAEIINAAG